MKFTKKLFAMVILLGLSLFLYRCTTQEKLISTILPPFEGFEVPIQKLTVNGEEGGLIELENGTSISIPANCFIDENGNPYHGEVELDYREFHTIADVIASGIPMEYSENGEEGNLATAGMIEL